MKLSEVILEQEIKFLTDQREICQWLKNNMRSDLTNSFVPYDITVVDGKVNSIKKRIHLRCNWGIRSIPFIPMKFGKVRGLWAENNGLTDFTFLPDEVIDGVLSLDENDLKDLSKIKTQGINNLYVRNCNLTSFKGCPDNLINLVAERNPIKSLMGVEKQIKRMQERADLALSWEKIEEGGIGLVLIPGLCFLRGTGWNEGPWVIINEYLGEPEKIYDCQTELIENGYEEFAKL